MIYFGRDEAQMVKHIAETVSDHIANGEGYEDQDVATLDKVETMAKARRSFVITDGELDQFTAAELYHQVVSAEVANWVPNASQRLIWRVARALGHYGREPLEEDHGPNREDHPLTRVYVARTWFQQCVTCDRLFPE